MAKTRIGITELTGKKDFIELPDEVALHCPICETPVTINGKCSANFVVINLEESETKFAVVIYVNCKNCGCQDAPPVI